MDLLNILINPSSLRSLCFLCFKQDEETLNVNQKLFICDEYQTTDTTLTGIMKYLFPAHDILLNQACTDCTSLLLTIFTKLLKHNNFIETLKDLTTSIDKEVKHAENIASGIKEFYVKLDLHVKNKLTVTKQYVFEDISHKTDQSNDIECTLHCEKCNMKFESKYLLDQHEKLTHKSLNQSAICEFCGKDCKKPSTLRAHLNCHKLKSCPHCLKTLKSHAHFNIHVKNHDANVKINKRLLRKSEYFCKSCPFKSFNKKSLEAHNNKVHLRIRPYVCEICNKGFFKKSNLTEHKTIHTKVKNLTCEHCGDSFVSKKTLSEHLRLHSGERPYQCHICSATFVTSGRRSDHFKRKHMEKTICCIICDKKFSLRKEMKSHLKKVHGEGGNSLEIAFIEPNSLFNDNFLDKEVNLVNL